VQVIRRPDVDGVHCAWLRCRTVHPALSVPAAAVVCAVPAGSSVR
jgi:hypothetical protein